MTDVIVDIGEIVVTGPKKKKPMSDEEMQAIIDGYNQDQAGSGGNEGAGSGNDGQTADPAPSLAEIMDGIRAFVASLSELDSVGNRDANTRFERNETDQTTIDLGDGNVAYFDNSTGSYWFDQNGNGTVETRFWIGTDGVWYDINNDGAPDILLSGF